MRVPRNYDVQILHAVGIYVKCKHSSLGWSLSALLIPDNLGIRLLMFSCIMSLFSNKWGNSFLSPNHQIHLSHHCLNWTQPKAASSYEECKAESSLWWLPGEFSFQVNENNLRKSIFIFIFFFKLKKKIKNAEPEGFYSLIGDRLFQMEIPVL